MDNEKILTSRGYRIPINASIMKELTIYSDVRSDYPGPRPKIICYKKTNQFLYLPRYYGFQKMGKPDKKVKEYIIPIDVKFNGKLRPKQQETIDKTLDNFKTIKGGLWSLHTGFGKTATGLYLIAKMKVKTIIIVHKQILLDQWKERIAQFLPDATIGIIQGPITDTTDKDITLAMVQSLTRKEYPKDTFKSFGMTIIDECHCICSTTFSEVLFMIQTKYRIGLSATPNRKDGFDKVFNFHLGPTIFEFHKNDLKPTIKFHFVPSIDVESVLTNFGKVNLPKLITDISNDETRNNFIIKILKDTLKENRKILVFSDRVHQCETLNALFKKEITGKTSETFIGKNKKEQNDKALESCVIFATYGICKEGFDCPSLDTLLFATPKSDVIQAVGRILRRKNEFHPVVLDIVDKQFGTLKGQYYKRRKYYKSKEFEMGEEGFDIPRKNGSCLIRNV